MTTTSPEATQVPNVFSPKIGTIGDRRFLALRWFALEFDRRELVQSANAAETPGIKSYKLFEAYGKLSLEEAMKRNPHAMNLHISTAGNLAVVSTQIGYPVTGEVEVPAPRYRARAEHSVNTFDMVDYGKSVDERDVLLNHVRRLSSNDGDPAIELTQEVADDVFRMMWSGLEERR